MSKIYAFLERVAMFSLVYGLGMVTFVPGFIPSSSLAAPGLHSGQPHPGFIAVEPGVNEPAAVEPGSVEPGANESRAASDSSRDLNTNLNPSSNSDGSASDAARLDTNSSESTATQSTLADPGLDQTVADGEETELGVNSPKVTITEGHIDLGPRLVGDKWVLAARDDTAKTPVWRYPADMTFVLGENSVLRVPDKDEYKFLGVPPHTPVYVIPQNQVSGVPWLGWNTQAPELAAVGVSGLKLRLTGHEGPGEVQVFLQSGNFASPQKVWSTTGRKSSEIYLDVNTHTHANWVFTRPGVHLLQFEVQGTDGRGRRIFATAILRFAVGKKTTVAQAQATKWLDSSGFEGAVGENVKPDGHAFAKGSRRETGDNPATVGRGQTGGEQTMGGKIWIPTLGGALAVLIPVGTIMLVKRRISERDSVAKRYATGESHRESGQGNGREPKRGGKL